ncbi:unnamed protein product [Dibothriocephalus latus]|uniref:G-protein coupled receptors family 1 profile domain-containing protein n=1 Tax=Dibothriocephalus latus TaxID=60516 RepID=A0A3P7M6J2_DIBLA|nr:unnamed protein product [Dibothriocephalus latus]
MATAVLITIAFPTPSAPLPLTLLMVVDLEKKVSLINRMVQSSYFLILGYIFSSSPGSFTVFSKYAKREEEHRSKRDGEGSQTEAVERRIFRSSQYRVIRSKHLRTPSNMLTVNLAIADMAFSLLFPSKLISSFYGYWIWGKLACEIYGFCCGLFGFASLNTAAMISIDRYLVIVHSRQPAARTNHRRTSLMIAVVWLWSLFWSSPPFYGFGRYIPDGLLTSCSFDYLTGNVKNYIHVTGMYIFQFLIPVGIVSFCYIQVVLFVKGKARRMASFRRTTISGKFNIIRPCKFSTAFFKMYPHNVSTYFCESFLVKIHTRIKSPHCCL